MHTKILRDIITASIVFLMLYTALSKLIAFDKFFHQLQRNPVTGIAPLFFAVAIPLIEIIIAIMLCLKPVRKYALFGFIVLMSVFTVYISGMLMFADKLPCSCGGVISAMSWKTHLLFNCFFIVAALVAFKWNGQ